MQQNTKNYQLALTELVSNSKLNKQNVIQKAMEIHPEYFQVLKETYDQRLESLSENKKMRYERSVMVQDMIRTVTASMMTVGIPFLLRKVVINKYNRRINNLERDLEWKMKTLNETQNFFSKLGSHVQNGLLKAALETTRLQRITTLETLDYLMIAWFIGISILFMLSYLSSRRDISILGVFRIRNTR